MRVFASFTCLSVCLSVCLSFCLSVCLWVTYGPVEGDVSNDVSISTRANWLRASQPTGCLQLLRKAQDPRNNAFFIKNVILGLRFLLVFVVYQYKYYYYY